MNEVDGTITGLWALSNGEGSDYVVLGWSNGNVEYFDGLYCDKRKLLCHNIGKVLQVFYDSKICLFFVFRENGNIEIIPC